MADKHKWLRNALADKKRRAKDVAKAWDVDEAAVSRFIKKGEPELNEDRAKALCRLLGMEMPELVAKMAAEGYYAQIVDRRVEW